MKFHIPTRIFIILIWSAILVPAAKAQSNCCQIQTSGPTTNAPVQTVPPDNNGPGGTYVPTATQVYGIACINSQTATACNSASMPQNSVTATGKGANVAGHGFIQCNPIFTATTVQSTSTSGAAATFTNQGTGYASIDSNGNCIQQNPQPVTQSQCVVVACATGTGSGGGCNHPKDGGCCCSPILIDIGGEGFELTSAAAGVRFDMTQRGYQIQMGWTAAGAKNAFLCLPDSKGKCDDGADLFGNWTPQPPSDNPNGFAALAVYDTPVNGGNGDGIIDSRDAIFSSLRLWIDVNHDGISQPNELFTLPSLGVYSISLKYEPSERTDQYGNFFRYRSKVNPNDPDASHVGRIAYDVFFVSDIPASSACRVPATLPIPARSPTGKR